MSSYAEAIARLVTARRFGVVLGLERMRELLDKLGKPDERLGRVIHVGGTNGKGSTVAMLASIYRAAGYRVGAYTSPHLNELRERIAINGAPIAYQDFGRYADQVVAAGGGEMTFFEQVTAIALLAFADAKLDVTIIEVGLGGRLDATNAVRADVAIVTGVAMDHEAILGDTLEAIAREKAGIFKRDQIFVIGRAGEDAAIPTLVAAAQANGSDPFLVTDDVLARVPPVGLPGAHQRINAGAALVAIDLLALAGGPDVDGAARAKGLAEVTHPGRFEIVKDVWVYPAPAIDIPLGDFILDGAHNPHGAVTLAAALRERGIVPSLIIGVSADKDVRGILRALLPAVSSVMCTCAKNERSMPLAELMALVKEVSAELGTSDREIAGVSEIKYAAHAIAEEAVLRKRHWPSPTVVAGSLFLVGEARAHFLGVPSDPANVTDPAVTPR